MSGICGIVHVDGAAVDRELLHDLAAFMAFRGPDATHTWLDGRAGLGHTLLRTTHDSGPERQPVSVDGRVWITADARIDAQDGLRAKLVAQGRAGLGRATDAELILHAYHAWGDDCLEHLIGDFAFAIWDAPRRELFCARDPFGVKPFFYARLGRGLAFSNTLNCVRRHPEVSANLDELAIADLLLFEMNQDPAGTVFTDIRRLPPGHRMILSERGLQTRRYWSLPAAGAIRYRHAGDYVERFTELLGEAVSDRLRTARAGVLMSGGLDSSAVAANAFAHLSRRSEPFELSAHTIVYDRLIPDEERHYSDLAAKRIGIPIRYVAGDDYALFGRHAELGSFFAEPVNEPHVAMEIDLGRAACARTRVMLTGWDGDALLAESPKHYFGALLRQGRWARALAVGVGHAARERKLLPRGLMLKLNPFGRGDSRDAPSYPSWLNADFERRHGLRERWLEVRSKPPVEHAVRPYAYRSFTFLTQASSFFERYDPGCTGLPLEYRHPLLDVRLVEYCLALPPYPWCVRKEILRRAMRGALPEAVRLRPKSPLAGYPYLELLRRGQAAGAAPFVASRKADQYIRRDIAAPQWQQLGPADAWAHLRPYALDLWLRNAFSDRIARKEPCHEST